MTIKQMSLVTLVAMVTICLFIAIQMFDFIQQRRSDSLSQLNNIGRAISYPVEHALWNRRFKDTQRILDSLIEQGTLNRATVLMNTELISMNSEKPQQNQVTPLFALLLSLPVTSQIPLYSPERNAIDPLPIGYLILEADSYSLYQTTLKRFTTVLVTYLLLALMLSVAISWCLNRLLVYPLRAIANDLKSMSDDGFQYHQLTLPLSHQDDELGMLVRNYNRNQEALAQAYQQLSRLSTRDPVTELPNYTLFQELLKQQIASSKHDKTPFSLLFVSLDSLKDVFQAWGQQEGNHHLLEVTKRIQSLLSPHAVLARLHGEELVIMSLLSQTPLQAMQFATRLIETIGEPIAANDLRHSPRLSIGIAQYPGDGEDVDGLMAHAQSAMLLAQRRGKNQVLFFEPDMTNEIQQRMQLESEIVKGIAQDQFQLYLQPQIDIETGRPVGAEALIRWHYAPGKVRYPIEFIPHAEESGLILPLGQWVLEEACRILAQWKVRKVPLTLSVNLSAMQLQHGLIEQLSSLLRRYDFEPERLVLELTETGFIHDVEAILPTLKHIRELGIAIALDDFGSGYSNLNYLQRLPVDLLKVDKSFIDGLPYEDSLVRIVYSIAQTLRLKLVAEGVESQSQADWLLANGIRYAQGYLFSRAIPYEQFNSAYLSAFPTTDK
ncbi:biofilm formation regulator HmsP [Leminorella grimontii]|nr:biofilm formation regulator HmsP [Leminorella grimontii]